MAIAMIDGIQISIMTILNSGDALEGSRFRTEAHPHVQRVCNFLFSGSRLPSFLIGRLFLASFIVGWLGRSFTLVPHEEGSEGLYTSFPDWFIFFTIRTGFCPTLLIMTSSVIGRAIATLKPVTFLSLCGNTLIIFVCLGLEQTGVTQIIWPLADLFGSMCCLKKEADVERHEFCEDTEDQLGSSNSPTQHTFETIEQDVFSAKPPLPKEIRFVQKTNVTRYAMKYSDWKEKKWHLDFQYDGI